MEDDLLMFNFIKYHNLDVTIVATMCDKLKQSDRAKLDSKFNEAFELANNDNIVYFSSVTKEGKDMVHKIISECLDTK
jgi:GTP-binding protein